MQRQLDDPSLTWRQRKALLLALKLNGEENLDRSQPCSVHRLLKQLGLLYPQGDRSISPELGDLDAQSQSWLHQAWIVFADWFITFSGSTPWVIDLKRRLGYISLIPIEVGGEKVMVRGIHISYHDLYHLEVSQLARIPMGNHWVSGIHGINSPVFHDEPIVEEYASFLDEGRIAFHEMLTRSTLFTVVKGCCWIFILALRGINPWMVIWQHRQSLVLRSASVFTLQDTH